VEEGDAVGVNVAEGDTDGVFDGEGDGGAVPLRDSVPLLVLVHVELIVPEPVRLGLGQEDAPV
jgi:hypothetical protein